MSSYVEKICKEFEDKFRLKKPDRIVKTKFSEYAFWKMEKR